MSWAKILFGAGYSKVELYFHKRFLDFVATREDTAPAETYCHVCYKPVVFRRDVRQIFGDKALCDVCYRHEMIRSRGGRKRFAPSQLNFIAEALNGIAQDAGDALEARWDGKGEGVIAMREAAELALECLRDESYEVEGPSLELRQIAALEDLFTAIAAMADELRRGVWPRPLDAFALLQAKAQMGLTFLPQGLSPARAS